MISPAGLHSLNGRQAGEGRVAIVGSSPTI